MIDKREWERADLSRRIDFLKGEIETIALTLMQAAQSSALRDRELLDLVREVREAQKATTPPRIPRGPKIPGPKPPGR
jgi:hypothetical protein